MRNASLSKVITLKGCVNRSTNSVFRFPLNFTLQRKVAITGERRKSTRPHRSIVLRSLVASHPNGGCSALLDRHSCESRSLSRQCAISGRGRARERVTNRVTCLLNGSTIETPSCAVEGLGLGKVTDTQPNVSTDDALKICIPSCSLSRLGNPSHTAKKQLWAL